MKENNPKNFSKLNISYQINADGFSVGVNDEKSYAVFYPQKIWRAFNNKNILAENFIYARTAPLAAATRREANFNFNQSVLKKMVDLGIIGDLPHVAFANKIRIAGLRKLLKSRKNIFTKKNTNGRFKPLLGTKSNKALLALSFGKDSLLTYGLAKELGIECHLVYVNEMEGEYSIENEHKRKIIKEFIKDQNIKLEYLEDNIDSIFYNKNCPVQTEEFDNSNGINAFC
jgi:hypothetical protein